MANERCTEEEAEATLSNLKMEGRRWLGSKNGFPLVLTWGNPKPI